MKKVIALVVLVILAIGGMVYYLIGRGTPSASGPAASTAQQPLIGFSLGTLHEERWQKDVNYFTEEAQKLGAAVVVKYSDEDPNLQISQADNLIIQGVKVLVVVAQDAASAGAIVQKAHAAGIKVIAYDRMITNSDVDLFVTFDSRDVGKLQAQGVTAVKAKGNFAYIGGSPTDNNATLLKEGSMTVLDPLIKKGDVKLVVDSFSKDWQPEEAYNAIKAYLSTGKTLDAVVAANDGTAGGVVQALKEFGLDGKVPVSGQDADAAAGQRIVAGTQTMTVYKPIKDLAYKAAELAVSLAQSKSPDTNGTLNNGKIDVPSYFLTPVVVTKANLDAVLIDSGFHTRQEIYGK